MTTDRELERALTDWLEGQPSRAPVELARSIFAELERVPQRAWWGSAVRRIPVFDFNLSRAPLLAGGLAAVLLVGAVLVANPGSVGGPKPTPSLPPSPSADAVGPLPQGTVIPVGSGRY